MSSSVFGCSTASRFWIELENGNFCFHSKIERAEVVAVALTNYELAQLESDMLTVEFFVASCQPTQEAQIVQKWTRNRELDVGSQRNSPRHVQTFIYPIPGSMRVALATSLTGKAKAELRTERRSSALLHTAASQKRAKSGACHRQNK